MTIALHLSDATGRAPWASALGARPLHGSMRARRSARRTYAGSLPGPRRAVARILRPLVDLAVAGFAYARQAKDSQLIQYATEIKVRAERRCGELLARTEKNRGAATPSNDTRASTPTLREMGITYDESSRYQQLAAMPAEHFETAVATAKATAGEVGRA